MRNGLKLSYWHATPVKGSNNPYAVTHDVATLLPLITKNTRIIAITACSNILGSVVDVKSVVKQVCVQYLPFGVEVTDCEKQVRAKGAEKGAKKLEISVD